MSARHQSGADSLDVPSIRSFAYGGAATAALAVLQHGEQQHFLQGQAQGHVGQGPQNYDEMRRVSVQPSAAPHARPGSPRNQAESPPMSTTTQPKRRLVKVIVADPDPNVPIDSSLVHKTDEFLTDQTDQELFFDLDIKALLVSHNELRRGLKDKDKEPLPAIRARDLKMAVITIAEF